MALVRTIAIADFTANPLSTTQNVGYSTSPPAAGQHLYAGLHLTAVSTGRTFAALIAAASSSGAAYQTEISFALTSEIGSTWKTIAAPSTDRQWRRLQVTLSTAASTAGSWYGHAWVGFR